MFVYVSGRESNKAVCVLTERNVFIIENINPVKALLLMPYVKPYLFSLIGVFVFVLGGAVVFRSSRGLCGCSEALKCLLLSIISMVTVLQCKPTGLWL